MNYQLPNGRVIYVSIEEYLSFTDTEFHIAAFSNFGDEPSFNSFSKSRRVNTPDVSKNLEDDSDDEYYEEEIIEDDSIDFDYDSDEFYTDKPFDINNIPDESFND